MLQIINK